MLQTGRHMDQNGGSQYVLLQISWPVAALPAAETRRQGFLDSVGPLRELVAHCSG